MNSEKNTEALEAIESRLNRIIKQMVSLQVEYEKLVSYLEKLKGIQNQRINSLNTIIAKQTLSFGELAYDFYKLRGESARELKEAKANINWLSDNLKARNSQLIKKDYQINGLIKAIKKERLKNGK